MSTWRCSHIVIYHPNRKELKTTGEDHKQEQRWLHERDIWITQGNQQQEEQWNERMDMTHSFK